jgi:hypothetical protein
MPWLVALFRLVAAPRFVVGWAARVLLGRMQITLTGVRRVDGLPGRLAHLLNALRHLLRYLLKPLGQTLQRLCHRLGHLAELSGLLCHMAEDLAHRVAAART